MHLLMKTPSGGGGGVHARGGDVAKEQGAKNYDLFPKDGATYVHQM